MKDGRNWQKALEDWIGKGVMGIKIDEQPNGKWRFHYKENGKTEHVDFDTKEEAQEVNFVCGGKNADTVRSPDEFLEISENFNSKTFYELGHEVHKLTTHGYKGYKNKNFVVTFPEGTGHSPTVNSRKSRDDESFELQDKAYETATFTRAFKSGEELDSFINWILTDKSTRELRWDIKTLVTFSIESKKDCLWKRCKAEDGTSRMVLEFKELDGISFEKCLYREIISAADGMVGSECKHVPYIKPREQKDRTVCYFSATEGKIK